MRLRIFLFIVFSAAITGRVGAQAPVHFPCSKLKAVVEDKLWVYDPTPADMLSLHSISKVNGGITDLTGLEYAENLHTINFHLNLISDISPLSGLSNLQKISLGRNQIQDLSPLSGLSRLHHLDVHGNQLSNISVLSGLTNLDTLLLRWNQISDISALSGLTNLTYLTLHNNQLSNISPLAGLSNLVTLYAYDNQISDISALAGLTQLELLSLPNNQISNISALSGLVRLRQLYLHYNQISDVSALSGLSNLEKLYLHNNPLGQEACDTYIPQIIANNPATLDIRYSPCKTQYSLTVSSSAGGSVTDPGQGLFSYAHGASVPVTAMAQGNYHFVNWTGTAVTAGQVADTSSAHTTITIVANYTLHANFADGQSAQHNVSVSSSSGGSVTRPGEGVYTYNHDTSLSITAVAQSNHHFVSWTGTAVNAGGVANPASANTSLTVSGDYTLVANFAEDQLGNPSVHTYEAKDRTETSACLEAWLADDGGEVCKGWFRYWNKNSQAYSVLNTSKQTALQKSQQYVKEVRNLLPDTTYCFQAVAENSNGLDEGDVREFTTLAEEIPPASVIHVDDDAINDPAPHDLSISDPQEDGTAGHPYDSIQEAIDQAQDLDRILVHEGTYYETLNLKGKCVAISRFTPDASDIALYPVIDAHNEGTVVTFNQGEDASCILSGFVLTGGLNDTGSAIACIGSSPTLKNCLIVGNRSSDPAGAIIYCEQSHSAFENCTIADNYAGENGAVLYSANCNLAMTNSILWGNLPGQVLVESGDDPMILYTDVQGSWPGVGNIDSAPLFARPGYWADPQDPDLGPTEPDVPDAIWIQGDYHLLSESGRCDLSSVLWTLDGCTSPCIDAGDLASRWIAEPRPNGARTNMGAYGGTDQASLSQQGTASVALWTYDEGTGSTASDSAGNNPGTVHGASWTDGILNGALEFDGIDDYVDCGNDPTLAPDLFTISLWIRAQAGSNSRSILRKAGGGHDKDYELKLFAARHPTFSFGDGAQSIALYSSSAMPLNEWIQITLTRDETEAAMYINGIQVISKIYDFAPSATDHTLIIGGGSLQPYQGKIDDVQIYDSALSPKEIGRLMPELD